MTEILDQSRLPVEANIQHAWIELTNKCNFECVHCYAKSSPREPLHERMSDQDYLDAICQLGDNGVKSIQFIGGEPTLHPRFREFVDFAFSEGFEDLEVYTNLSTMTETLLSFLISRNVGIATSFYSHKEEDHARITSSNFPLERLNRNISMCADNVEEFRVGVILVGWNDSYADEIKEHLESLGVKRIDFERARGFGRFIQKSDSRTPKLCGHCGHRKIAISARGEILPCIMSRHFQAGTFSTEIDFLQVGEKLQEFREREFGADNLPGLANSPDEQGNLPCPPHTRCSPWASPCMPRLTCRPACLP